MKEMNEEKMKRAKKRVDEIKGFYIHASIYTAINIFLLINIFLNTERFWQWGHFITPFFWGIGLFFHASKVFGFNLLFSKNWEERQIQKYIDKDREDAGKYL
ncbi:MAG: 2TM domain-containing protein [Flavobacteriaceae bacterium]|uniref:2TM domain-containing protein n=1 Tax=Flagellimonas algarum TaxID=3230298 RepID=UPI003397941E|nr:2TM domain-containing protein [Flavobacteriaceae bacterium]